MTITTQMKKRFWSDVFRTEDPDACWKWVGSADQHGYGQFQSGGEKWKAHRFSFALHKGSIPEGLVIRHTCDNPSCVNPEHLLVGTQNDNMKDAVSRGRTHRGLALSDSDIDEIAELARDKRTRYADIAEMYGVSASRVCQISREKGE